MKVFEVEIREVDGFGSLWGDRADGARQWILCVAGGGQGQRNQA